MCTTTIETVLAELDPAGTLKAVHRFTRASPPMLSSNGTR
jgi:hypothetical protein